MLLKIVQGPNAGAEIVLAEGMTLSLGKGDACDILLADQSLADVACELEINSDRVRVLLPGGVEERLEPFHVKFLGEITAIAVGPEKGVWDELVWPTRGSTAAPVEEAPEETSETTEEAPAAPKKRRHGCGCGCLCVFIVFLLLALLIGAICYWPKGEAVATQYGVPVDQVKQSLAVCETTGRDCYAWAKEKVMAYCEPRPVAESLPVPTVNVGEVATALGLTYTEVEGTPHVSGNFTTRAKRLAATAELYAVKSGVVLDLSDDESLRAATTEVLDLVSEGKLKVYSATNRMLGLEGFSPSASELRSVLEAIRADVPHVDQIDCARVTLGEATGVVEVEAAGQGGETQPVTAVKTARNYREHSKRTAPKMPVVGVMTMPYPCLVLKDGSRVTEGAEFGGFIIEQIGADTIRVRGPEGTFEWRP